MGRDLQDTGATVIDGTNRAVLPGFVDTVMAAGRVVEHGGRLVHGDLDQIRERAIASRERLFAPDVNG